MNSKSVVDRARELCCCATYRALRLDDKCGVCQIVDAFNRLDYQRADMWRMLNTVKINSDGAMSLTESLRAVINMLGETNDALAACQSEGQGWKRLAEERGWKNDSYEYLLSEPGSSPGDATSAQLAEEQRFRRSTMYWHERAMKAEARLQKIMARCADLLDEDQFNELDAMTRTTETVPFAPEAK